MQINDWIYSWNRKRGNEPTDSSRNVVTSKFLWKKIRETTKILKYEVASHTKNKNHIHNTQCAQWLIHFQVMKWQRNWKKKAQHINKDRIALWSWMKKTNKVALKLKLVSECSFSTVQRCHLAQQWADERKWMSLQRVWRVRSPTGKHTHARVCMYLPVLHTWNAIKHDQQFI